MRRKVFILLLAGLCAAFSAQAREKKAPAPFDRGIEKPNTLFIPAGTVGAGATFNFTTYSLGKGLEDVGFQIPTGLINGVKGSLNTFKVSPNVEYFLWDNSCIGARFSYGRTKLGVGGLNLSIGDDLSFGIKDYNFHSSSYEAYITLRNYMPIAQSKRFAIILEGRIGGAYSQSKSYKVEDGMKHGTYTDTFKASFDFFPGLCVFIMNNVALIAQMGVFGISYRWVKQTTNHVDKSIMQGGNTAFGLNLLSVEVGTSFYILDRRHNPKRHPNVQAE